MKNDLIPRRTAETMVANYKVACDEIRRGYALLRHAEDRLKTTFQDRPGFRVNVYQSSDVGPEQVDVVIKGIARDAWRAIAQKCEFRRVLSTKREAELDLQLADGDLPELTFENMLSMVRQFGANIDEYMKEAVREVFDLLRPAARSSAWNQVYKTNEKYGKFDIGRKVILSGMVSHRWSGGVEPNPYREQYYRCLDNVFHMLDGKGAIKSYQGPLWNEVRKVGEDGDCTWCGETIYFRFRACKNGNLHLEFKRMDLVRSLNAIAAGAELKEESKGDFAVGKST